MAYYPRSSWTSIPKGGTTLEGSGRTMTRIYIHYPGQKAAIGAVNESSTKNRLQGYRRQHKNVNGWADIAYNLAVDQKGNVWELRGVDKQSGANGGTKSNRHGQAILVLVGNNEKPTAACIRGIQDAIQRIRKEHPKATTIRGHKQSPDASTECPGSHLMKLVRSGALEPGSSISIPSIPSGGTSVPVSKPSNKPSASTKAGKLKVDGRWGTESVKAYQRFLNSKGAKLKVDGRMGPATHLAGQKYFNAPYKDGKVSRQSYKNTELGNGVSPKGWEYTGRNSKGSQYVKLLQKWAGATQDGIWYEGLSTALQKKLNSLGVGM